jgi:hypothetical protein
VAGDRCHSHAPGSGLMLAAGEGAYHFPDVEDAAGSFGPLQPRLLLVAYRMLGSMSDAEDVVQEAFI